MLLAGIIPPIIMYMSLNFIPESPRFLMMVGRDDEAKDVLNRITTGREVEGIMDEIKQDTVKNNFLKNSI